MKRLDGMAIFTRVVELDSFTGAARDLGLSKSAVSKQVSRLEDRLGVRLLNRTTRRLSLTEAGATFYEGCVRMLAEAEATEYAVSHLAAAPRGLLKVNAPISFGVDHLAPLLPEFMERYPELAIELTLNDRFVDLVDEGFDLAIRVSRLVDSSLVARQLAPNNCVLVASPRYVERHGAPRRPQDLKHHDCLLYSYLAEGPVWRLCKERQWIETAVQGRFTVNNGEALIRAALGGLGIAYLPTLICGDLLRAGRLLRVLPGWFNDSAAVYAVYPAGRNPMPKVRVFIDFLLEHVAPRPYWDRDLGFDDESASAPAKILAAERRS